MTANTIDKVSVLYDQKHQIKKHCFNRKALTTKEQKYLLEKLYTTQSWILDVSKQNAERISYHAFKRA